MASDDESQLLDTHHEERDWEEHKENFRICYLDKNMTRKDAAEYMKQHFNFNATPRQWERKIKQWGFSKYTARDERLAQIAHAGKTVLDVSRPGRRPRSLIDEYGNLQPHEDRNLRRFARREVSRSRSRSRSASFVDRPRPQFKSEFSDPSVSTTSDPAFNYGDLGSEMQGVRETSEPLQHTFFQAQQPAPYGSIHDPSKGINLQHQWNQSQQHGLPSFQSATGSGHFGAYPNGPVPLHSSPPVGLPNTDSFGYGMQDPTPQPMPPGFGLFPVPGMMPEDIMTEQEMFDNTMQLPQATDAMDQTNFDTHPSFTFALVEPDSSAMMPTAGPSHQTAQPVISIQSPEQTFNDHGTLGNDVLPLVEQYTRAVQVMTLGSVSRQLQNDALRNKLAADLEQPSRMFMASMAIILENFAKTQQRSLQSMKDTCSKLRQKNAVLEQLLNGDMQAIPSIEHQAHPSSDQPQTQMYGDIYSRDY